MSHCFNFKSRRAAVSAVLSAAILIGCWLAGRSMKAAAAAAALFLLSGCVSIEENTLKRRAVLAGYGIWFFACALAALFLSQMIMNESVFNLPLKQILLGLICCCVPVLILFSLTTRLRFAGLFSAFLLLLLSTANHYVYAFRGSELCPSDFQALKTAVNVAEKYTYSLPNQVLYSWLLFAVFVDFSLGLPALCLKRKGMWRAACSAAAAALCAVFITVGSDVPIYHFLTGGSYMNGFLLNFTLEIRETVVRAPEDYSREKVEEWSCAYAAPVENERTPDIIVIMDEAYSDLGVLGQGINTSIPVSPFISSLRENTTRGYTLSSVYGGNTPNSEYEFLTGNSMLFLNGVVYQQYLRQPSYSMVSWLKDRGYTAIAMHPYLPNGWRRETVWPNLLFDKCMFLEDYPQKDLIRELVSDREMFEVLLDEYAEHTKASDGPIFIFGVTMQNHSAYDYSGEDFESYVKLTGYAEDYPEVEQYLTLIHETDKAVEYLIHRLENADRDVVAVFYGDHQPAVSQHFIEEVHGSALTTLDDNQLLQKVPFFIWTNYDSDETELPLTSLNYLSGYVFEKAGMELPAYNRFIRDIETVISAVNARGYYSNADGRFKTLEEASGIEKEALQRYWTAEYNSIFDLEHLDQVFFPLKQR